MLTVITQNYVSCSLWPRNAFKVHTACDLGWVLQNVQFTAFFQHSPGLHIFSVNVGTSLKFQEPDDTNQVPHSGPTIVSRHRKKFIRPGHLALCICVPLVSALRVGQVCDVISPSVIAVSWTASRYGVSLLLFSASQPRQPTGPSELCVSVCSFRNYTSQQLAAHLRWIFL
jgi:hypothetical protein